MSTINLLMTSPLLFILCLCVCFWVRRASMRKILHTYEDISTDARTSLESMFSLWRSNTIFVWGIGVFACCNAAFCLIGGIITYQKELAYYTEMAEWYDSPPAQEAMQSVLLTFSIPLLLEIVGLGLLVWVCVMPHISDKILAHRLDRLEQDGLLDAAFAQLPQAESFPSGTVWNEYLLSADCIYCPATQLILSLRALRGISLWQNSRSHFALSLTVDGEKKPVILLFIQCKQRTEFYTALMDRLQAIGDPSHLCVASDLMSTDAAYLQL